MKIRSAALILVVGTAGAVHAQAWEPGRAAIDAFAGRVGPDRIFIQLRAGTAVTFADGVPVFNQGAVAAILPAGLWTRVHDAPDAMLDDAREAAEKYWDTALPDLKLAFYVKLAPGTDVARALDAARAVGVVEYAVPCMNPAPPTVPGNFDGSQRYVNAATDGIGAAPIRTWPGGTGSGVRVVDIEYSWNTSHQDLPTPTRLGSQGVDPFNDMNHGTAVLGEIVSRNNGWGTTGAAYDATPHIAYTNFSGGYNLPGAITTASTGVQAGDVLLIEQQWVGPNAQYCPVEWYRPNYDSIRQAVGSGRIVVEAAGNGGENLDDVSYRTGNGNHWPFLAANDSGAIIVGAGAAPASQGGSTADRSRLGFSCYGSTVDLQGWGERVVTTGYGDRYNAEGANLLFTSSFSGTSSASPIVASACVLTQAVHRAVTGRSLTPAQVKAALVATGSPQQSGNNPASQQIGPRPNVPAALARIFGDRDCNGNGRPDAVDIALASSQDRNHDGIPDECQPCPPDFNGDGFLDFFDYDAFVDCFESGSCPAGRTADFNADAFVDFFDYDAFVQAFGAGCP